jgi:phosphoglycerol transferase MdoB-like AlkP superfamily enzyme
VKIGDIPCNGATTNAEFRELSGLNMNFHDALNGSIPMSLPKYLRERGFNTLAIHGYTKNIFGRDIWYPAIGFDRMIFLEDLINKPNYHRCGSILRGSCDHELALLVREELLTAASEERLFIYWLTLNAHLPIVNYRVDQLALDCDQLIQKPNGNDLCGLLKILLLTQLKIADIARAPNLEPTRFIIVGDHPPHFASVEKRGLFIKDRVPFIELLRKKEENK